MTTENTPIQVREELLLAKQSRLEGNEGRARVCARRAAGAAVKMYLSRKGFLSGSESVVQSLIVFSDRVDLPSRVQVAVDWLVQRVDQNYNLPPDIDLINEANVVLKYLMNIDSEINSEFSR
jgi:hypothetical protein